MQRFADVDAALARRYPDQVVLVATKTSAGKENVMAVGWVAIASSEPVMFAVGIDEGAFTHEIITQTKEFVVAYPAENMGAETLLVGKLSGRAEDKIALSKLSLQPGIKVRAPLIADAVANFECKLVAEYKPGDCPLLIGEVVAAHVNENANVKRLYILGKGHKLGPITLG